LKKIVLWGILGYLYSHQVLGSCSPFQKHLLENIAEEFEANVRMLNHHSQIPSWTLSRITKEVIIPKNLRPATRFPQAPDVYKDFFNQLTKNLKKLEQKKRPRHLCMQDKGRCSGGDTIAYVLDYFGYIPARIYFCSNFFEMSDQQKVRTYWHEISHYALKTQHYFGTIYNREGFLKQLDDAYFYEKLSRVKAADFISRQIIPILWNPSRDENFLWSNQHGIDLF
jgi:hypothetical protein